MEGKQREKSGAIFHSMDFLLRNSKKVKKIESKKGNVLELYENSEFMGTGIFASYIKNYP